MLAKFEKRAYVGSEKVWVGKYRNLQNISHWHMEHEMIVCMEGCAQVMVADTIYTLLPKSVIFCQSGCVHYIHTDPDCLLLACLFDEKLCEPLTHPYQLSTPLFQDHYNVLERLTAIRQELSEQPRFFEVRTIAMIEELMTDIFRSEPLIANDQQPSEVTARYKQLLDRIDHEFYSITFYDAALFMNVSESYFSRYFKRQAGMTFSQYLNVVRIEKAVQIINAEPDLKVTDVMSRCGFNTIRSFNRAFKLITGYTPRTIPKGYVLNTRSFPAVQGTFDPTLAEAELLAE